MTHYAGTETPTGERATAGSDAIAMSIGQLPESADVVVVGAGIIGASVTFTLTERTDTDVLLLERGQVASGSTGDSSSIIRHHYGDEAIYSRMAWWSHEFFRTFEERTGEQIAYATAPMVNFATAENAEWVAAGQAVLEAEDIPVSRYEAAELPDVYPMLGTEQYEFAVSDDAAAYSDATDVTGGLVRAAQENGATVHTGVTVESIEESEGSVEGVTTDQGQIATDTVVVAAGPWTQRLLGPLGVDVPVTTTREQIFLLDPPPAFAEDSLEDLPTSGTGGGWYIRPDFGDGVLLATHHTGEAVDPDRYSDKPDQALLLDLLDGLEEFVPGLADAGVMGEYCGIYSTTPDHDFIIDEVGPDGCVVACGFSGHGFKHGPAVGRIVVDLLTEGATDMVDLEYFSLDRFEDDPQGNGVPQE